MNKKAIATDAIAIIAVLFFTIIITTGTLFGLNFATKNKQTIEIKSETINQGITLKNYLRTPITSEKNMAEFIVQSINEPNDEKLIEEYTKKLSPFFWELQIFDNDKKILTIKGNQNKPSKNEKIIQEQEIPNYFGMDPKYYTVRMVGKKTNTDLVIQLNESTWSWNPLYQ